MSNAVQKLTSANGKAAEDKALKFIDLNFAEVAKSKPFRSLTQKQLLSIVRRNSLGAEASFV